MGTVDATTPQVQVSDYLLVRSSGTEIYSPGLARPAGPIAVVSEAHRRRVLCLRCHFEPACQGEAVLSDCPTNLRKKARRPFKPRRHNQGMSRKRRQPHPGPAVSYFTRARRVGPRDEWEGLSNRLYFDECAPGTAKHSGSCIGRASRQDTDWMRSPPRCPASTASA